MKRLTITILALVFALGILVFVSTKLAQHNTVKAQSQEPVAQPMHENSHKSRCSNRTGSGTYGYQMNGSIVGVGAFLVNGLFTANPDGTTSANVRLTINGQTIPATGTNGTFTTNDDCTGSGKFFVPQLNQQITYNSVLTDNGEGIELINTNPGIVLQGHGKRIAPAYRAPRCNSSMIEGDYGYRLEGSLPGVPNVAAVGLLTHFSGGRIIGFDAASFNGAQVPRRDYQGTYKLNRDCTGTGNYKDSLGTTVDYVFTVVDEGKEIFLQGANGNGDNIFGVARRVH
jgi:hypothetical protein